MTGAPRPPLRVDPPGSPGYAHATRVFNLSGPVHPRATVTVRSVGEVVEAIRHARASGLGVRCLSTGHAAPSCAPMDQDLLLRVEMAEPVTVDPQRQVVRVPAGSLWGPVATAAARHGLVVAHGSSATVGAVGYLLRGGVSLYGRWHGIAANGVVSADVVLADGTAVTVDASDDPELFWALRGGGGGLGVVTALELRATPARDVLTGHTFWPIDLAEPLLRLWRDWAATAATEASTSFRILRLPEDPLTPGVPSGDLVCVAGAVLDPRGTGADAGLGELLEQMRAVGTPLVDTWERTTPLRVTEAHLDPDEPLAILGDHLLLRDLPDAGLEALLDVAGPGADCAITVVELRQLGGRLASPARGGGALDHVEAPWALMCAAVTALVEPAPARASIAALRRAMSPLDTGRTLPTFVEDRHQPQRHLDPAAERRVADVRRRVDPAGLFVRDVMPQHQFTEDTSWTTAAS